MSTRRGQLLVVAALAVGCFTLTLAAFVHARATEYRVARAAFESEAMEQAALIRQQLMRSTDRIESIADVVRLNPQISEATFQQHAALAVDRYPSFYSLAWSRWVPHKDRQVVAAAMRRDGYGVDDIDEVDEQGRRTPAQARPHYLVLRHFYPAEFAGELVGTDILARPSREAAIRRAMETAQPAATGPIRLGADPSALPGVIVFVPIFDGPRPPDDVQQRRERFRGTVSVGLRLPPALERWLGQEWADSIHTVIYDSNAADRGVLFERGGEGSVRGGDLDLDALRSHSLAKRQTVDFAGRPWHVLSVPTDAFDAQWRGAPLPWLVLGVGLLLSVLLPALARVHLRHHAAVRAFADERAQMAASLQQLNEALEQRVAERTGQLQRTIVELSQAEQRERRKLAQVLHDDHQQLLVAIKMQLGMLRLAEPPAAPEQLDRLRGLVDQAIASSRSLSYELSPAVLHAAGLAAALHWLAPRKLEKYGLTLHVDADESAEPASANTRVLLFELVRELLLNVVKHAGTDEAWVTMRRGSRDQIEVVVEDRGRGFDKRWLERSAADPGGMGLSGMRERMASLGGELDVQSEPGAGTRVTVRLTMDAATNAAT